MANVPGTSPPLARRPWHVGIAPNYITLFLWVAFYDQLAGRTLAIGGLAWSTLGAASAGLLCYQLLYYVPAMWGLRSGRPLEGVAASTFGEAGATLVPGVLMGVAHVVWFAVATFYATDYTLRGLATLRLLDPKALEPIAWRGLTLRGPLFLLTALAWTFLFAAIGAWVVRLIAAIMTVFPIFPAAMLAAAMLWGLGGLPRFRSLPFDPATAEPIRDGGPRAALAMIQLVCAFFATAGASAADWGAACRDERDVRLGGLVGVALAATVLAVLAMATVAGAQGRRPTGPALATQANLERALAMRGTGPIVERARRDVLAAGADDFTFASALQRGVGGRAGGAMLLVFALGSMAPAVYAAYLLGGRFAAAWPSLPRTTWTLLGAAASFPLVALGIPARVGPLFGVLGAAVGPVVGAMAADYARRAGAWPGPRRGVSLAGLLAWGIGLAVGLAPLVGPSLGRPGWSRLEPATLLAFLAAFLAYSLLAALGLEPPASPAPARDEAQAPAAPHAAPRDDRGDPGRAAVR